MVRPRMRSAVLILALLLAVAGTGLSQQSVNRIVGEGIEALKAGEFVRAQQIFAQLVKDAPSAENLGYLAMAEAGAGNLAQAIGHFQRSIRLGNNWASVHYNLGIACLQAGRREEGIRELRTALARDGKFLPARYPLGIALLGEGRPREALPYLTEATKASPQRADVWANLLRAQFEVGDHLAALQTTERAMRAVPNDPRLDVALANLCLRHGELPKTRSLLEEANAANPREASVALLLARVSLQIGEPKEALAVLENLPPEAGALGEVMLLKGEARALAGDFALAEVDLAAARDADPQNLRYLIAYAWLQQREGHYKEALTTLKSAHEFTTRTPAIPFRAAVSYFYLGLNAQAAQACEDALRIDPDFSEAYLLLGVVRLQQQDFQGAQSTFQRAASLKPDVALFHILLGVAFYKRGHLQRSARELNRALALDPQAAPAYFYRAQVLAIQGEQRKAIADLETAVALNPHYRKAYAELARLYSAAGQPERAAAALAKESAELRRMESEDNRMFNQLQDFPDVIGGLGLDTR